MLVGILSDSHGHVEPVKKALQLFDRLEVGYIIHCGDVGGTEVFDQFIGRPFTFVWGNTDNPGPGLETYLQSVGLPLPDAPPVIKSLEGKRFAVFHGHELSFRGFLKSTDVDFLLHGHTHTARSLQYGDVRIINPGALHRTARKSVATLNLENSELTFHEID